MLLRFCTLVGTMDGDNAPGSMVYLSTFVLFLPVSISFEFVFLTMLNGFWNSLHWYNIWLWVMAISGLCVALILRTQGYSEVLLKGVKRGLHWLMTSDVTKQLEIDAVAVSNYLQWHNQHEVLFLTMIALKFLARKREKCKSGTRNVLNVKVADESMMDFLPDYTMCKHDGQLSQTFQNEPQLAVIAFANNDTEMRTLCLPVQRAVQGVLDGVRTWEQAMQVFPLGQAHLMFMAASLVNIAVLPVNVSFRYYDTPPTVRADLQVPEFENNRNSKSYWWNNELSNMAGMATPKVHADSLVRALKDKLVFKTKPECMVLDFNTGVVENQRQVTMLQLIENALYRMNSYTRTNTFGLQGMALRFRTLHLLLILNQKNENARGNILSYFNAEITERQLIHALQLKWHEKGLGPLQVTNAGTEEQWYLFLSLAMMLQTMSGIQVLFDSECLRCVEFRDVGGRGKKSNFLFASERISA